MLRFDQTLGFHVLSFLDSLEFATFSSIWYWVFMALAWSSRSHWTLGAPFDGVVRAERRGGPWEDDLDMIVHAMSRRVVGFVRPSGHRAIGVGMFFLASLVTGSIVTQSEFIRGLTALAIPMAIVTVLEVRLALRVHDTGLRGYDLRRALVWQRFLNQATGLCSLLLAAAMAAVTVLQQNGYPLW